MLATGWCHPMRHTPHVSVTTSPAGMGSGKEMSPSVVSVVGVVGGMMEDIETIEI